MHIIIPGELPNLNQIIEAAKTHWTVYRDMKAANTELVAWYAKGKGKVKRADIIITWYTKDRRTDPDNTAAAVKFILDGLVDAGVLKNDGCKVVRSIKHEFEYLEVIGNIYEAEKK